MNVKSVHPWNVSYADAIKLQRELAERVIRQSGLTLDSIRLVAGADVSYSRATNRCYSAVVVLSFPKLEPVCQESAIADATFPYIPGLLSFREIPSLVLAFERLETTPDVVIADGQGIAHPRRLGLASHLGLLLDMPTVGCAKSRLVGKFEQPGQKKGASTDLMHREELIGAVLRTRTGISPVFVSIGHKIDLPTAVKLVLACSPKFRLPETTRTAHNVVINMMRNNERQQIPNT